MTGSAVAAIIFVAGCLGFVVAVVHIAALGCVDRHRSMDHYWAGVVAILAADDPDLDDLDDLDDIVAGWAAE